MLPVLNISDYLADPESPSAKLFTDQLRSVCHDSGFFYLVGHNIEQRMEHDVLDIANQFFDLETREREAIAIGNSPHFRGYTLLESEVTAGKPDLRDQIDIGPEEPAVNLADGDPPWLKLRGPNQWPVSLPSMPDIVTGWMDQMQPVGMALMRAVAEGLGQQASYFDDLMAPAPYTRVKIIRYPAPSDEKNSDQGLGLHHDSGVMTLILQDAVPGLQVMSQGKLVDVKPMAGAYVVNLGEMLQTATSGYLRATKHQVVSPPLGKQRISIAYFLNPRLDASFEPIPLPPELASQAPGGQNADTTDPVFATFGANTLKIRMRAHPDVTANFYHDVDLTKLLKTRQKT